VPWPSALSYQLAVHHSAHYDIRASLFVVDHRVGV
jgi:hypothetical protein